MLLSSVNFLLPLLVHCSMTAAAGIDDHPEPRVRDLDNASQPSLGGLRPILRRDKTPIVSDNLGFPWRRCVGCVAQCIAYTAVCGAVCFGGEVIPVAGFEACLVSVLWHLDSPAPSQQSKQSSIISIIGLQTANLHCRLA